MPRSSTFILTPTPLIILCEGPAFLHIFCRRRLRRYERHIKAAYAAKFEERAWIARSLNENLTRAVLLSQSTVNAMRLNPRDALALKTGFTQIAQWLDVAAEDGDTALRSLETSSKESRR